MVEQTNACKMAPLVRFSSGNRCSKVMGTRFLSALRQCLLLGEVIVRVYRNILWTRCYHGILESDILGCRCGFKAPDCDYSQFLLRPNDDLANDHINASTITQDSRDPAPDGLSFWHRRKRQHDQHVSRITKPKSAHDARLRENRMFQMRCIRVVRRIQFTKVTPGVPQAVFDAWTPRENGRQPCGARGADSDREWHTDTTMPWRNPQSPLYESQTFRFPRAVQLSNMLALELTRLLNLLLL